MARARASTPAPPAASRAPRGRVVVHTRAPRRAPPECQTHSARFGSERGVQQHRSLANKNSSWTASQCVRLQKQRAASGEQHVRTCAPVSPRQQISESDARCSFHDASVIRSRPTECLSSGLGLFLFARATRRFRASSSKRNERASLDEKRTRDVPLYEPFDERSRVGLLSLRIPLIFTRRVDRLGDAGGDGHLDAASAHDVRQLAGGALRRAHARL